MSSPTPEPTSSILQAQALNSTAKKRLHKDDCELSAGKAHKKRKREAKSSSSGSSVVAATIVSQSLVPSNSVTASGLVSARSPRRDKDKKKKKKKKRKMSIVASEFEDDRVKHKHSNPTASASPTFPLSGRMKADSKGLTDVKTYVAGRNGSDKRKGKEKAFSPTPSVPMQSSAMVRGCSPLVDTAAQAQIESLKQQLESQAQLLKKHQTHLASVHQSLTCQICLDLLYKPFALTPCGHVACYDCLVRWFTTPGPGENAPDNQSSDEGHAAANEIVMGNHIYKRKTCPICRARVFERPVEVWGIKDMVNALVRSKLVDVVPSASVEEAYNSRNTQASGSSANAASDPWHRIFRLTRHIYGDRHQFNPFWQGYASERVDGPLEDVGMYDTEDHVHRCLDCMHEIWGGRCSHCDRIYPGHPEVGEDDEEDEEDVMNLEEDSDDGDDYGLTLRELLNQTDDGGEHVWHYDVGEGDTEEEEEFFSDDEDAWEDVPVSGFMDVRPLIWDEPHELDQGIAHVEEVNDDEDEVEEYDGSFIDDGEEGGESVGVEHDSEGEEAAGGEGAIMRMQTRSTRPQRPRGPRVVVDSDSDGPHRRTRRRR